jgi:hypothetical protein
MAAEKKDVFPFVYGNCRMSASVLALARRILSLERSTSGAMRDECS